MKWKYTEEDEPMPCQGCNGGGQVPCPDCNKDRPQLTLVACERCDGSGYLTCYQCEGRGEEVLPW